MAVQTVVIDVFQTNKKLKEFDKNIDRLGKSFEKMRKQMERFNQDKRSTGLSLSQGDMFSKSVDKMTNTMTKLFSNGIKINNPTVNAKVTVDFAKMNLAGQMGSALKNADIAGTILRNLRLPKMGISNASAFKVDIPNKMQVEITNKELQVKLPKEPSQGKKQGFLTGSREKFDEARGKYVTTQYRKNVKSNFQRTIEKNTAQGLSNAVGEMKQAASNFKDFYLPPGVKRNLKSVLEPDLELEKKQLLKERTHGKYKKVAAGSDNVKSGYVNKFSEKYIKGSFERGIEKGTGNFVKNLNFIGRVIPDSFNSLKSLPRIFGGMKTAFSGLSLGGKVGGIATAGISIFSIALKGLTGAIKGAAGIIKGVIGIFQNIASVVSSVWGQVQKWAVNPMVDVQNQISQNKGYWDILGGEEKAKQFDDLIFQMSEKSPFSHNIIDSVVRKYLNNGVDSDTTLRELKIVEDTAAAQSLDDSGFENIATTILQLKGKKIINIEDITQGLGNVIPALKLITEGITGEAEATKESIAQVKEAIENGDYDGGKIVEGLLKGMERNTGIAEEIASTTYMGLQTKIKNMFKSNIVRKWGTGLSEGLTEGLSKFARWLDDNRNTFETWGNKLKDIGKEIGEYITGFLQRTGERIKSVFNSTEFQQADLSDKIVIFWDKVIKDPFSNWWESTGRQFFHDSFYSVGDVGGEVLSGIVGGLLGANPEDAVGEGYSLGLEFVKGFMHGFDTIDISAALLKKIGKISWDFTGGLVIKGVKGIGNWLKDSWNWLTMSDGETKEIEEEKVLPDSKYANIHLKKPGSKGIVNEATAKEYGFSLPNPGDFTAVNWYQDYVGEKEMKKYNIRANSVQTAKEIEYERAGISGWKEKNELTDDLQKRLNDLTWEYNYLAKQQKEALDKGDTLGADLIQDKMLSVQGELNDTTKELETIYPDIINWEKDSLDLIKEKLKKQKELNDEIRKGRIRELKEKIVLGESEFRSQVGQAKKDKYKLDAAQYDLDIYKDQKSNFIDNYQNYKLYKQKAENADPGSAEKIKLDKIVELMENKLAKDLEGMEFSKTELEKGLGSESDLAQMLRSKQEEKQGTVDKLEETFIASNSGVTENVMTRDEFAIAQIEEAAKVPIDQLGEQWKHLKENQQTAILGIAKGILEVRDDLGVLDECMDPVTKKIFIDVVELKKSSQNSSDGVQEQTENVVDGVVNGLPSTEGTEGGVVTVGTGEGPETGHNAKGNILMSPQLSWVAEAGPEAIIPLTGPYKNRGIDLWEKAGQMLGVTPKYAKGGIVGSYEIPREAPHLYRQIEEAGEETENEGSALARVDVGGINISLGGVNFTFNGTEANSREGILNVIKEQMPDIADEIAGTIAVNIQRIFANMKLQTA